MGKHCRVPAPGPRARSARQTGDSIVRRPAICWTPCRLHLASERLSLVTGLRSMASAGRLVRPFTPTACAQARQLPPLQSARAHTRIHRSRSSRTHARTLRAASAQACPPHARQHAPAARTHAKPRGSARERPAARRPHSGSISERVHVPRPHGRISLATPPPSPRHFCTAGRLNRPTGRLEPEAPPERHRRGGQSGASSRAAEPTCGSRVEGSEQHASRTRARTSAAPRSRTRPLRQADGHEGGLHARHAP